MISPTYRRPGAARAALSPSAMPLTGPSPMTVSP